ncbi:hypothetical protein L7F22_050898 [Adiantum nelumboides]|nr:hypothetical protein [Adiantum nelumboides]
MKSNTLKDIEPIVDAYIKGKRVSNVYVDGGAQMCVITERTMHRLGLGITEPSDCHAKLANNSKVKCLEIIKDVHIIVLDVSAKVDFYVMPSKGEGYPLILGRTWLMEVNADQKGESGKLVLQKGKRIVYDMKLGKQSNICFETSTDEESESDESSYGDEESYTSEESSMEVMGFVFQQPQAKESSTSKEVEVKVQEEPMLEERLRKMLAKDLTKEEEEDYINMFKRYPHLFITDYSMIKEVDVIQHHIDLKLDAKPIAQKLRRLGVVQQEALLSERVEDGLQRLYQYGGKLNPDKCHVAEKEVVLLWHVISQEGIKVEPSRVQAILDLPPPNSARQVITFVQKVRACKACQQASDRKLSYGPRFSIFAYGPFEKWGIDVIGTLPRTSTNKQYILTTTDYMTRWAEAASVARITAVEVRKFVLDYICSRFGTPLEILSDRGPGFRADLLNALLESLSIKQVHLMPYSPQCNGLVEKTNGSLCKIITKHVRDRP